MKDVKSGNNKDVAEIGRVCVCFVAAICVLFLPMKTVGNTRERREIPDLENKAKEYIVKKQCPDSALMQVSKIIRILGSATSLSDEERVSLVKAYNNAGYISMFYAYDYEVALRQLLKARELCKEDSLMAVINYNFGNIYSFYAFCFPTRENQARSLEFMKRSYEQGVRAGKTEVAKGALRYLMDQSMDARLTGETIAKYEQMYREVQAMNPATPLTLDRLMLSALKSIYKKNYMAAVDSLHRQLALEERLSLFAGRGECLSLWRLMMVYKIAGQPDSVFKIAKRIEAIAVSTELADIKVNSFRVLSESYELSGSRDSAEFYRLKYYEGRDSLLISRRLSDVDSGYLLHELKKAEEEVLQLNYRRRVQWIILGFVAFALLLVSGFMLVLKKKNHELSSRNEALFAKSRQLLEQNELKLSSQRNKKERATDLSDEERKNIEDIIEKFLSDKDNITSSEFTLEKLAVRCGVHSRRVSQILNDKYGKSFSSILQEQRCKLACMEMTAASDSRKYTIESYGINVGFQSRTAFIRAFKNVVGMTPSEYLKIVRSKQTESVLSEHEL